MEDPWKPVVTIRLDGKGNGGRKQKWAKEEEVRKMEKEGGREGEGGERVAVDVPMCSSTKSINLVCSSEHVGQQCPLREQPRRTSLRPLFRPRFHVVGVPGGEGGREGGLYPPSLPARALPTTSRSQKTTHASTVHGEGFSSAPATVERPLECHSSKFATRQVASSRMALPASSSGDEVEGNPSSQTGRGLGDQIFAYPPREDGIGPPRTFLVFLPSTLLRFHAWSRFRGVTDSRRGNRE